MKKLKVGVIFGGVSTEHDVSIVSGSSVIKNLNKETYEIYPIYIDKDSNWYKYTKDINKIDILDLGEEIKEKEKINNIIEYLKQLDVVFPVLHGLGGEDGSIQGFLEYIKVPYVGCNILSSSIGLDKVYTKAIWEKANIPQVKYRYIRKYNNQYIYIDNNFNENICSLIEISKIIEKELNYPMFIKPSNYGSSVGISKVHNLKELQKNIEYAASFDRKVIIEEGKNVREIECAVIGNENVVSSCVGEILSAEDFYNYNSKYKNIESKTCIPANITKSQSDIIRKLAIKAYKSIDGKGLARVDFFIDKDTNDIYINEINTMPGFTKISMYPQLWNNDGLSYDKLLDKLINLAMNKKL